MSVPIANQQTRLSRSTYYDPQGRLWVYDPVSGEYQLQQTQLAQPGEATEAGSSPWELPPPPELANPKVVPPPPPQMLDPSQVAAPYLTQQEAALMAAAANPATPQPMAIPEPPPAPTAQEAQAYGDPTKPYYQDGYQHQNWSGQSRTDWMAQRYGTGDGGGPAQQVTVPSTGASAGPYGVRAPESGSGYYPGGGSSQGGGSSYGGSSYGSYDTGPTQAQYRRSQKQQKQDWRQYEREQEDRSAFYNAVGNPSWAIQAKGGLSRPINLTSGAYDTLAAIPAGQLLLMGEASTGKNQYAKKPEKFGKDLADLYAEIYEKPSWFQYDDLARNLFKASKDSSLGGQFTVTEPPEAQYNKDGLYRGLKEGKTEWGGPSQQIGSLMSNLNALYDVSYDPDVAAAKSAYAAKVLDAYGAEQMGKRPGNYDSILKWASKYLS